LIASCVHQVLSLPYYAVQVTEYLNSQGQQLLNMSELAGIKVAVGVSFLYRGQLLTMLQASGNIVRASSNNNATTDTEFSLELAKNSIDQFNM